MMKTVMIPFIKLGDRTLAIKTESLEQGTVSSDEVWIACDDCGENLVDGPCRNGAAECYGCGKRYPLIFKPVQVADDREVAYSHQDVPRCPHGIGGPGLPFGACMSCVRDANAARALDMRRSS